MLRLAGVRDDKVYIGPEVVHLHVTSRCNLSCLYCWYHAPRRLASPHRPKDLSVKKFREILADCAALKVDALYFSGEGEPTCHPRFSVMMSLLAVSPLTVTLFTNGTFPPAQFNDVLKADRVIINLGAMDRAGYRKLQGRDLFGRVIKNIRRLAAARDLKKPGLKIEVVCVVNKLNVSVKDDVRRLTTSLGVDSFVPVRMQESSYNEGLRLGAGDGGTCTGVGADATRFCVNGWFYAAATVEGKMSLCCQLDEMQIADLKKVSLKEAWLSKEFMRMRRLGKSGRLGGKFDECKQCRSSERHAAVARKLLVMR